MSKTPQPVRGTQSLLGEEADRFHAVIVAFDRVRRLFGFRRVEVPVIEATQVFARSIGETTDVVSKEMYSFEDRSGDSITLRPELTAGICREQCKQCCVHAVNLVQRAGGVSRSLRRVSCERAKVVLEQVNKLCQIGRERRGNMLCQHPESVLQSLECMR